MQCKMASQLLLNNSEPTNQLTDMLTKKLKLTAGTHSAICDFNSKQKLNKWFIGCNKIQTQSLWKPLNSLPTVAPSLILSSITIE